MSKFKVGTKVRIKRGLRRYPSEDRHGVYITPDMRSMAGQIFTIDRMLERRFPAFKLEGEDMQWTWTDDMVDIIVLTKKVGGELV